MPLTQRQETVIRRFFAAHVLGDPQAAVAFLADLFVKPKAAQLQQMRAWIQAERRLRQAEIAALPAQTAAGERSLRDDEALLAEVEAGL